MVVRIRRARKADMVMLFIEILFFALMFFIAYKVFNMLISSWIGQIDGPTKESLDRLRIEMDNMVREEATVPIQIDEKLQINSFKNASNTRGCTGGKSCLCICAKGSKCENNALKKCVPVKSIIFEDTLILPHYDTDNNLKIFNCILSKKEAKVTIRCP